MKAYEEYQIQHEKDILQKGAAFPLIKAFLNLNNKDQGRLVEVIIMSRNNPNTSLRIFNSIAHYGLGITRAALTSGAEIAPYLNAFKTDLFLSANAQDVQAAINKRRKAAGSGGYVCERKYNGAGGSPGSPEEAERSGRKEKYIASGTGYADKSVQRNYVY